jgi:hypothetical protein
MLPRLRQIAVITRQPEPVEDELRHVLGLALAYRYPGVDGFGLGTAYFPIGNEMFEVVVAAERGTVADRFIDRRGGQGGFIVMLECRDLSAYRQRAEAAGVRVVGEGDDPARGRHVQFHPKDTGGTFLELHEPFGPGAGEHDGPWPYGGDDWRSARRTRSVTGIVGAEIQSEDPGAVAARWSRLLDRPACTTEAGDIVMSLRGGHLRFARAQDGRGEGLGAIDVRVADREHVVSARARASYRDEAPLEIGGLRINLVD